MERVKMINLEEEEEREGEKNVGMKGEEEKRESE